MTYLAQTPLNPRQRRFVDEYVQDLNATQAAIRAGYSQKTARQIGHRLLTHVDVRGAIENKKQEIAARSDRQAVDILRDIVSLKAACMALDKAGRPVDAATAARCLELEGRYHGMWQRRPDMSHDNVTIHIIGLGEPHRVIECQPVEDSAENDSLPQCSNEGGE